MIKSVYLLHGEGGLIDTVVKLTKEGYDVCCHGTHSAGLGQYIIEYSGEVEKAIDQVQEQEAKEVDWNHIDSITKKADLAEYFKETYDLEISTEITKKEMLEEFKAKVA